MKNVHYHLTALNDFIWFSPQRENLPVLFLALFP